MQRLQANCQAVGAAFQTLEEAANATATHKLLFLEDVLLAYFASRPLFLRQLRVD